MWGRSRSGTGLYSSGTGFLVRPGLLMTNAHVIDSGQFCDLMVAFPSAPANRRGAMRAELVYEDPRRDLAL
ncbi:MAG: S1 family peptidase, partial [Planctomycetaceae bacterium]